MFRLRSSAAALVFAGMVVASGAAHAAFTNVTAGSGISYTQHTFDPLDCLMGPSLCAPEANTGGAAAADVDGDGWVDLFVTRLNDTNLLYCNDGDGTFSDCTAGSGLGGPSTGSNGARFGDIDNDGDPDLYVLTVGDASSRFHLFINDGTGVFTEEAVARGAAIDDAPSGIRAGMSVAFGDYDKDGYLDIYTTEWRQTGLVPSGTRSHSRLLHNLGEADPGHFEDVTIAADVVIEDGGAQVGYSVAFSAAFSDLDDDGWPDLAVTCDYNSSRLYWNDGDGTFTDGTGPANVATDYNGMGSTFGDFDADGDLDWFVTSIFGPAYDGSGTGIASGNRLYVNQGNRSFVDETDLRGVRDGQWGWGTGFFDFDHDADLDLVMTNGYLYGPYLIDPVILWSNDGSGNMVDVTAAQGINETDQGRGLLLFDYDRDGDLDIYIVNHELGPLLLRNDQASGNDWLQVRLEGVESNRDAVGARVRIQVTSGGTELVREIGTLTQFLAQSERMAHFGLGSTGGTVDRIEIEWPSGTVQSVEDVAVNQRLFFREGIDIPALPLPALGALAVGLAGAGVARLRRTRR